MADRVVRVGASLDANVRNVFRPLVEAARQARRQVDKELQGIGVDLKKTTAKAGAEAGKRLHSEMGRSLKDVERDIEKVGRAWGKAFDVQKMKRDVHDLSREMQRMADVSPARRGAGIDGGSMAYRMGYWSMRNFAPVTPMLSVGGRIARDVAGGLGADFSISSRIGDFVSRQALATQISNSAWLPGRTAQVSPDEILQRARGIALTHGVDQKDVLGGLSAFVGKTGDLDTALKSLDDMAKLSKATGSEFTDLLDAAAAFSNQLGEGSDKAKTLSTVMRAIAGQGQVGAIEIKDMAEHAEKLAAFANDVRLDKTTQATLAGVGITDRTAGAVAVYGALAQAARAKGGRRTAGMATQASFAFMRDLSSKAELERLSAAGIDVFADKGRTTFRDPKAIILDVLNKTKGDQAALTKLIPNENSRSVFRAFGATYNETSGTNKQKLEAVSKAFDDYLKVTMSSDEIQKKYNASMNTAASKTAVFNAKIQEIADRSAERLLPTLEKLEPTIIKAVDAFAKLVDWAAENPWEAVTAAFAASVAKAGLEQVLRVAVERAFAGRAIGGALGGGGGAAPTLLGGIGAVGAIAAIAPVKLKSDANTADTQIANQRFWANQGLADQPTEMTSEDIGQARVETLKKRFAEGSVSREKILAEVQAARAYAQDYADVPEVSDEYRKLQSAKVIAGSQDLMNIISSKDITRSADKLDAIHQTLQQGIKVKVDGPPGGDQSGRFSQVDANNPAGRK